MNKNLQRLRRFVCCQTGAEVTELALVLGLIVAGVVLIAGLFGVAVQQLFAVANDSIP